MSPALIPAFFHESQLAFKPLYEWALGQKITHPETTARAESILAALQRSAQFDIREPKALPLSNLRSLHNYSLLTLYNAARSLPEDETFYPCVFPGSSDVHPDPNNIRHAGYFCFDSGTPLNADVWNAATWSAACAKSAAMVVRTGKCRLSYALSRPPGHHASRDMFGGYCYFNNAAVAAKTLGRGARVAILDIDFHHGNGTQSLFYRDKNILVISIHGDPHEFFPFFTGYASETGAGAGAGFNLNLPLPGGCDGQEYLRVLEKSVLPSLRYFGPHYLIVSAGLDTYVKDPIGRFSLQTQDYHAIGDLIGRMGYPTVVVQEGGYYSAHLGTNLVTLLRGISEGQQPPRG